MKYPQVVAVDSCLLQPATANMLLDACKTLLINNTALSEAVQRVSIRSAVDTTVVHHNGDPCTTSTIDPCKNMEHYVVNFQVNDTETHALSVHLESAAQTLQDMFPGVLRGVVCTTMLPQAPTISKKTRHRKNKAGGVKKRTSSRQDCMLDVQEDAVPRSTRVIWGSEVLHEARVGPVELQVSANSFFQVNPRQV